MSQHISDAYMIDKAIFSTDANAFITEHFKKLHKSNKHFAAFKTHHSKISISISHAVLNEKKKSENKHRTFSNLK